MAATVYEALADPTRRRVIELLAERERTAGELARAFTVSRPAVSRHLRVLREAGLVGWRGEAQRRIYSLETQPLDELDGWIETLRRFWLERLDQLERHLDHPRQEEER
jgi:DNA-binding transcriptional ArsR family regulator